MDIQKRTVYVSVIFTIQSVSMHFMCNVVEGMLSTEHAPHCTAPNQPNASLLDKGWSF